MQEIFSKLVSYRLFLTLFSKNNWSYKVFFIERLYKFFYMFFLVNIKIT